MLSYFNYFFPPIFLCRVYNFGPGALEPDGCPPPEHISGTLLPHSLPIFPDDLPLIHGPFVPQHPTLLLYLSFYTPDSCLLPEKDLLRCNILSFCPPIPILPFLLCFFFCIYWRPSIPPKLHFPFVQALPLLAIMVPRLFQPGLTRKGLSCISLYSCSSGPF